MNESTLVARTVVEQLLAGGVTDFVVAPGSRSAPLSWAIAQAASKEVLNLHVRIDERDAGFLALGLAKVSRAPVAVVVTSGTAVANLMPAVVEANYSGIPLVVVSADRPASARGQGAAQTIHQPQLFGRFVKAEADVAVGSALAGEQVSSLVREALGPVHGPVHLNVQFALPLMPEKVGDWQPQFTRIAARTLAPKAVEPLEVPQRGLLVVGDLADPLEGEFAAAMAQRLGWPLLWEPSANAHNSPNAVSHGVLLLAAELVPDPDLVVTFGRVGLSRAVLGLLSRVREHWAVRVPSSGPDEPNPAGSATRIIAGLPDLRLADEPDEQWLAQWQVADEKAQREIDSALTELSGPAAAVDVWNHAGDDDQLFVAASWAVRHLEAFAPSRSGLRVLGNRGANGIDGLISTAWGAALACENRTYLLIGDVAFLHDIGGLNVAATEPRPDLTIVVLDNNGSGIFSQLEQGAPEFVEHFERVFGTPLDLDLWAIAETLGIPATRVVTRDDLRTALTSTDRYPGVHVIVCATGTREAEVTLLRKITSALAAS